MSSSIIFRHLTPRDEAANQLLRETRYPLLFKERRETIEQILAETSHQAVNLSIGMFCDGALTGYALVYAFQSGAIEDDQKAGIIFFQDLCMLPSYSSYVYPLLRRVLGVARRSYARYIVECEAQKPVCDSIRRHARVVQRLGYRIAECRERQGLGAEGASCVVRLEPTPCYSSANVRSTISRDAFESTKQIATDEQYTVHLIQSEEEWSQLEPHWNILLYQTPYFKVFQTYEYLRIWWRHFSARRSLFILTIEKQGSLIAIVPLQIIPVTYLGKKYSELSLIGEGSELDYPAFLIGQDLQGSLDACLRFLKEHHDLWDTIRLQEQDPLSITAQAVRQSFMGEEYLFGAVPDSVHPYIKLESDWRTFLSSKSRRFKKNLRAATKKLESAGMLAFESHQKSTAVRDALERYLALEKKSWKATKKQGISRNDRYLNFYRDLADEFSKGEKFHVLLLTLNKQPIAGTIALSHEGKYHSLHIAHDSAFNKFSPGTILESKELEQCFQNGYEEYDFMGGFLNNKSRWTSSAHYSFQLQVFQRHWRLTIVYIAYYVIKPWFKRLIQRCGLYKVIEQIKYHLTGTKKPAETAQVLLSKQKRLSILP